MNFKERDFYINGTILIVAIALFILLLNEYLLGTIDSFVLKTIITIFITTPLFLFLSNSLIEHYKEAQDSVKNLIDESLHELNTPISTIEININLLKKSLHNEKNLKRLDRITKAASNLKELYNKTEERLKDQIDLDEKEEFNLNELIAQSLLHFEEELKSSKISINNTIPKTALYTNRYQFQRAINNLISNAIKYNKRGGKIDLSFKNDTLTISDTGIGIETKNLFIIYEKSYQENPTTKGFGMGLSIVKHYCDKNKIPIKIETIKDQGTKVNLNLTNIMVRS